jgi:hypothetical protein
MSKEVAPGTRRRMLEDIPTRCCACKLHAGDIVTVQRQQSPNRLLVIGEVSGIHRVKRSTFMRCSVDA